MRVVKCASPKSDDQPQVRVRCSVIPTIISTQKKTIDETFLNEPVDLRSMNPYKLPSTPYRRDDSGMNTPISSIIGRPISGTTTPGDTSYQDELNEIQKMLDEIEAKKRLPKQKFHLSRHLQPPPVYRFCPERALADKIIQQSEIESRQFDSKMTSSVARSFPYDLFKPSELDPGRSSLDRSIRKISQRIYTF